MFNCEECDFKSGSMTLMQRHKNVDHCTKKSVPTRKSKRLNCNYCENKFNKNETLQKHMEKFHKEKLGKENIRSRKEDMKVTNQNDLPNSEKSQTSIYEVQQGATRLRNNKILKSPWFPNN